MDRIRFQKAETEMSAREARLSYRDMFRIFGKIGLLSFGGPAAQIALMHRELVEENKWLSEEQYLNALNFCMLLPGPEAMQLATYAGWRLRGTGGGILAGLLFVLPGAAVIFALAYIYALYGSVPLIHAIFFGIKTAVLVIVMQALLKVAKRALKIPTHWGIAIASFIAIFFFNVSYPILVLICGGVGFAVANSMQNGVTSEESAANITRVKPLDTVKTICVWLAIWSLPFWALWIGAAPEILHELATFFSKLAVVTFGGAYAVLSYMAQDVVGRFGWLETGEMIDGLGLAETTPGPLILVTEFVGFLAAFKQGGLLLAFFATLLTLWVTFVPCFLWIFAGAPYIDWIASQPRLKSALSAITAAVVGVILHLALWFGLHVLFESIEPVKVGILSTILPQLHTMQWSALLLMTINMVLLLVLKWNLFVILFLSALGGIVLKTAI